MSRLFTPHRLGALDLPSRVAMAPMTRSRTAQPGNVPTEMMAEYYAQRAGAGLIVSEATQVRPDGQGYSFTPGIHSEAQVAGWRKVTDAVHAAGGRIVLQLWHVGRMSHPAFHDGARPVAPSAIAPGARVWLWDAAEGAGRMVDAPEPRALEVEEIEGLVADFAEGARNAIRAGFDGVEIHGANGYLVDQFLRTASNRRTDRYGGPVENRLRFAVEVAQAVADAIGPERTGMRLAPFIDQRGMADPTAPYTILRLAEQLDRIGLAYIHLAEADWDLAPETPDAFRRQLRDAYGGSVIVAGGFDRARAEAVLEAGLADVVAFGRPFISNPDLPRRLRDGLDLAPLGDGPLYGGGAEGYTDYAPASAAATPA